MKWLRFGEPFYSFCCVPTLLCSLAAMVEQLKNVETYIVFWCQSAYYVLSSTPSWNIPSSLWFSSGTCHLMHILLNFSIVSLCCDTGCPHCYYISDCYWLILNFCIIYFRLFCLSENPLFIFDLRLMESGLLPAAEAKKVLERKLQKTGKFSSPAKSAASTPKNPLQISDREQGNKKTIIWSCVRQKERKWLQTNHQEAEERFWRPRLAWWFLWAN